MQLDDLSIIFAGGGTSPFAPIESVTVVDRDGEHPVTVAPDRNGLVELFADFGRATFARREPAGERSRALHSLESTVAEWIHASAPAQLAHVPKGPIEVWSK